MTVRKYSWLMKPVFFVSLLVLNLALAGNAAAEVDTDLSMNQASAADVSAGSITDMDDFVKGEVLVGFKPGASSRAIGQIKRSLKVSSEKSFPQIRVRHWKLPRGLSVEKAIAVLMKNPSVEYAEPNYIYSADVYPNDPSLSELWGMHNVGQNGGLPDADIDAVEAWDVRTDASAIVVGIIDTGIDPLHEDLADNIWANPGEIDGETGVDDDGNGYVDDIWGWDFVNDDNDPFDDAGHGTHVAGTIGGIGNNGIGVAGVAWSVKLMALKFLDASGRGETDDAIEAVLYAASMGVPITNNSWGGGKKSLSLQNAIESSNSLFVASAGNWNTSKVQYPAGYTSDNILSVAASDANDEKASFSNYGSRWVDLAAPGVDILSSLPGNAYDYKSGTSMAAPHVTGAAAMIMAEYPGLLPTEVKSYIMDSVDLLPAFEGITVSGGRLNVNTAVGGGSQPEEDTTAPAAVTDLGYVPDSATTTTVELFWTATADDGNDPESGPAFHYDLRYRTDEAVTMNNWDTATEVDGEPSPQSPGATESMLVMNLEGGTDYYLALRVVDEAGNTSEVSNSVTASTQASPWYVGIVNNSGRTGFSKSLALHPITEYAAIAYSEDATEDVIFAQWDGNTWIKEIAAGTAKAGVSLQFNPLTNYPAISHAWSKLYFTQYDGSGWSSELIERKAASVDSETSLAFDNDGNPCIAYRGISGQSSDLKIACNYGAGWQIEYVQNGAAARYISMAFDLDGNPVIAYSDDVDGDNRLDTTKLAYKENGSWVNQVVGDPEKAAGVRVALVIDPDTGTPMVADRANSLVRFSWFDGDEWHEQIVEDGGDINMAIVATGVPYISFSMYDPYRMMVARPVVPGSYDNWDIQTVEYINVGWRTSIAVKSSDGLPVVSYGDYNGFTDYILKWAERLTP